MIRRPRSAMRSVAIPVASLALLIGILAFGRINNGPREGAQPYFERVAAAIDAIPYRVDSWFGVNLPYTDVEVEMLRPNKLLQRTYQDPRTGQKISLSIVHCTEVRDMLGHYPPVCYPAHGWELESNELEHIDLKGRPQPARVYTFGRINRGTRESIRIISFFVTPGSADVLTEMDGLSAASKQTAGVGLGAAQIQILMPPGQSAATNDEMLSKLLQVVEPVISAIQEGAK